MATRDDIADAIAGMAIFVDLARPQLMGVASRFEEAFFPKDARVLRQGHGCGYGAEQRHQDKRPVHQTSSGG